MACTFRAQPAAPPTRASHRPQPVRAYLTSDVPQNVHEARNWIAAWKARGAPAAAAVESHLPTEVPQNVHEARNWIAAWKARGAFAAAAVESHLPTEVPQNVLEARKWIAAWKARPTPVASTSSALPPLVEDGATVAVLELATPALPMPTVAADGTITFSKALLDSSSYDDLIEKLRRRV